jgi:hypothetical protein
MYVCLYVCVCVCVRACVRACVYVCMYVCVNAKINDHIFLTGLINIQFCNSDWYLTHVFMYAWPTCKGILSKFEYEFSKLIGSLIFYILMKIAKILVGEI